MLIAVVIAVIGLVGVCCVVCCCSNNKDKFQQDAIRRARDLEHIVNLDLEYDGYSVNSSIRYNPLNEGQTRTREPALIMPSSKVKTKIPDERIIWADEIGGEIAKVFPTHKTHYRCKDEIKVNFEPCNQRETDQPFCSRSKAEGLKSPLLSGLGSDLGLVEQGYSIN